ncbi:MAG TPA: XdhC/CoxI family protein [Pyrinomonadaceae bacterium]|nr:XdhC/CoxI family protein [Pyrinomonadaceae bacterium]
MSGADEPNPSTQLTRAVERVLREGARAVLVTVVEAAGGVGAKVLLEESGGRTGTTGDDALDDALGGRAHAFLASRAEAATLRVEEFAPALEAWRDARVLLERIEPEPHVVVCGAGHVGASLARLAHAVGYRVTLVDDRADFVARERFSGTSIELVAAHGWAESVGKVVGAGRGVYVAVVTRGHSEDEECMRAVLAARPDYVGMIGSRRRTNIVLERLREAGFDEDALKRVRAPIGLDIGAVSPEEVALSVLAEIVCERHGGTGRPLSAWRRE